MAKSNPVPPQPLWPIRAAQALLAVAALVSAFLAWKSFSSDPLPGCGPDSGCDKALRSQWGYWFGIPVSAPGALIYFALLALTFQTVGRRAPEQRRAAWGKIAVLLMAVAGSVAWFVGVQALIIKSFCPFCLTIHGCGLAAAALLFYAMPRGRESAGKGPTLSGGDLGRAAAMGIPLVAVLVSGHFFFLKPTYRVQEAAASAVQAAQPAAPRLLSLHGGKILLDVNAVPVRGSTNAPHVMVSLFDYTCHHCRDMHETLKQVQAAASNQLAIISLPMPLDASCNPVVRRTASAHEGACEYARLSLAVWKANPQMFTTFDDWIFAPSRPPSLVETRQRAEELVGAKNLSEALWSPGVETQLRASISLYHTNSIIARKGQMPQLNIGSFVSMGPIQDPAVLRSLMAAHLGMSFEGAAAP